MPRFDRYVLHPNFEDHQQAAGRRVVTEEEVEHVWYGERLFVPNRRRRRTYLMVGSTAAGREITVVILPTGDATVWLLYTAW